MMIDLEHLKPEILWYVVGLIATDGNLSLDGRHFSISSKDVDHLEKVRNAIGLHVKITMKSRGGGKEKKYGFLQIGDVRFYRYLLTLGLTPRKSLTLEPLPVPLAYFGDFLRGVIDGDGNIHGWVHPTNGHEQWEIRVYSASHKFAYWLKASVEEIFHVRGVMITNHYPGKNPMYIIKFGKMAARVILSKIYYNGALALERKSLLAKACVSSYLGWKRSLTVSV